MKRKVWDITVKDNPNRVVMGENDEFYTRDTEAYLVFNLEDKNFNPATAVLTLENRNDGSLKNETVDVVDGLIEWEMPQRYIEHFGNWQGQLVYYDPKEDVPEDAPEEDKFETYTSAPFSFVVNAHIGDKKKPSLVEIENWEKFIREGTELIETWEDLEALREENERQRQANYQELLDTGVLQTNINQKLAEAEQEYAPRLTELEQNDADLTAQLAQKIDKGNVSVNDINKNLGKFDGTYFSDLFLEDLNNGTLNVTNVLGGSLTEDKFAFPVVEGAKSKNLFNKNNVIKGKYYDYLTGSLRSSATYFASGVLIPVEPNTPYVRPQRHNQMVAFFDEGKNFISGVQTAEMFTTPTNARYVGLSGLLANLETEQLEKGNTSSGYEPYGTFLKEESVKTNNLSKVLQGNLKTQKYFGVDPAYEFNESDWAWIDTLDIVSKSNHGEFKEGDYFLDVSNTSGSTVHGSTYNQELPESIKGDVSKTVRVTFTYKSNQNVSLRLYQRKSNFAWTDPNTFEQIVLPPTSNKESTVEIYARIKEDGHYVTVGFWSLLNNTNLKISTLKTSVLGVSDFSAIEVDNEKLVVKKDGTGDYTTIQEAIDGSRGTKDRPVNIYIHPGTYVEEIVGKHWVNLIGLDRSTTIIDSLPSTDNVVNRDTLKAQFNMNVMNLTIKGTHVKYCIHADAGSGEWTFNLINCVLEKKRSGSTLATAVGLGLRANQNFRVFNSIIIGEDRAFYYHNWNDQKSKP